MSFSHQISGVLNNMNKIYLDRNISYLYTLFTFQYKTVYPLTNVFSLHKWELFQEQKNEVLPKELSDQSKLRHNYTPLTRE